MATQRTSFTKLQRDRAKKAKAAAKRERRLERAAEARTGADASEFETSNEGPISAAELLQTEARLSPRHPQQHRRVVAPALEQPADLPLCPGEGDRQESQHCRHGKDRGPQKAIAHFETPQGNSFSTAGPVTFCPVGNFGNFTSTVV